MSRQRMTLFQKQVAILRLLDQTLEPLSVKQIGIRLGFKSGTPAEAAMCELYNEGFLKAYKETHFNEQEYYLFTLSEAGKEKVNEL